MKFHYEKPMIEVEDYELTTMIAAGCSTIVSLGPDSTPVCSEYAQGWSTRESTATEVPFSDETSCSCYPSSTGNTLMTS